MGREYHDHGDRDEIYGDRRDRNRGKNSWRDRRHQENRKANNEFKREKYNPRDFNTNEED